MGTQHTLNTEQLKLLILLKAIEEFGEENGNETPIHEILCQDKFMEPETTDELLGALNDYGYIDEDDKLTIAGKQYIALFEDDLQRKKETPNIEINNSFSLINLEKLVVGLDASIELGGFGDLVKGITEKIKSVLQSIKINNRV